MVHGEVNDVDGPRTSFSGEDETTANNRVRQLRRFATVHDTDEISSRFENEVWSPLSFIFPRTSINKSRPAGQHYADDAGGTGLW